MPGVHPWRYWFVNLYICLLNPQWKKADIDLNVNDLPCVIVENLRCFKILPLRPPPFTYTFCLSAMSSSAGVQEYWLPGFSLSRKIVLSNIHYFLGPSATVRPFTYQGREGYLINGSLLTRVSTTASLADISLTPFSNKSMISRDCRKKTRGKRLFA